MFKKNSDQFGDYSADNEENTETGNVVAESESDGGKKTDGSGGSDAGAMRARKEEVYSADINVDRYRDPEGLTIKKMLVGLWFARHRQHLKLLAGGIITFIASVSWSFTLYHFIRYFAIGAGEDRLLVRELVENIAVGHDFFAARSPKDPQYAALGLADGGGDEGDFVASMTNPNKEHSAHFEYFFVASGGETERMEGFILPGESKYLLALAQPVSARADEGRIIIGKLSWERVNKHKIPDWTGFRNAHLNIKITGINFVPAKSTVLTEKVSLNEFEFTATNDTAYNYKKAHFNVLLYRQNRIIGVNRYVADNFMSGEERNIAATWPGRFGRVDDVAVIPEIDITREDIYLDFADAPGEAK